MACVHNDLLMSTLLSLVSWSMQVSGTWLVYTMTSDVNSIVFGVMVNAGQRHVACVQTRIYSTLRSWPILSAARQGSHVYLVCCLDKILLTATFFFIAEANLSKFRARWLDNGYPGSTLSLASWFILKKNIKFVDMVRCVNLLEHLLNLRF